MCASDKATVLVTGATGLVGRALVERLCTGPSPVRALVRTAAGASLLARRGVETIVGDIADRRAVRTAVDGVDRVIHLAATPSTIRDAGEARRVHVEGTRALLEAAERTGVARIVHVSTVAVHGAARAKPIDEASPLRPEGIYATTKLDGEAVVRAFAARAVPIVVVRPAPVYGPGDLRLLPLFRMALRRRAWLLGRGDVTYHPIHVDDLVRALVAAADAPSRPGETFLVAGPEPVRIAALYHAIARAAGRPGARLCSLPVLPLRAAARVLRAVGLGVDPRALDFFVKPRAFCTDKAVRGLGFVADVSIERGVAGALAWYVENGYLPATALPPPFP